MMNEHQTKLRQKRCCSKFTKLRNNRTVTALLVGACFLWLGDQMVSFHRTAITYTQSADDSLLSLLSLTSSTGRVLPDLISNTGRTDTESDENVTEMLSISLLSPDIKKEPIEDITDTESDENITEMLSIPPLSPDVNETSIEEITGAADWNGTTNDEETFTVGDEITLSKFFDNIAVIQQQQQRPNMTDNGVMITYENDVVELFELLKGWLTDDNIFCKAITNARNEAGDPNLFITVNVTFGCQDLFTNGNFGTGNYIALFYAMRLSTHVLGNIDLYITCHDAEKTRKELIIPWIMGYFPARLSHQESKYPVSVTNATATHLVFPLICMYKEMRHDLRRMAIALVGIPQHKQINHPSAMYAQQYVWPSQEPGLTTNASASENDGTILLLPPPKQDDESFYKSPQFDFDDAVIHFRCGDVMSDRWDYFEAFTFSSYVRHISQEAQSIGILTQPFERHDGGQYRGRDVVDYLLDHCKVLTYSLVEYIRWHHPNATVTIHNNVHENVALTYSRIIMANQSIAILSSFGELGSISSFGTAYVLSSTLWVRELDLLTDTVIFFDADGVSSFRELKKMWQENGTQAVLQWFWNGIVPNDEKYCGSSDICNSNW